MPRITISEPGKTPQPYRLKTDRKITKIGRGSDNDIILETGSASTYHCEMLRVEGGFILKDNDSTNGIILEGTRFKIIDLVEDATISIGDDIDFNFELSEEEIEILEEEDFEPKQQAAFPKSKAKAEPKKKKKAVSLKDEDEDDEEEEYEEVVVRRKKKKPIKKPVDLDEDEDDDDEDEKEEEAKPKLRASSKAPVKPRAAAPLASSKPGGGIGTTLIFAALAVVFLLGGMVIRHYQDHGTFLFNKQSQK